MPARGVAEMACRFDHICPAYQHHCRIKPVDRGDEAYPSPVRGAGRCTVLVSCAKDALGVGCNTVTAFSGPDRLDGIRLIRRQASAKELLQQPAGNGHRVTALSRRLKDTPSRAMHAMLHPDDGQYH